MRLLIILLLITFSANGQPKDNLKGKPSTLDECYNHLDRIFDDTSKYTFKMFPEKIAVSRLHHGLGTWIRNEWGLWRNSNLKKYFENMGVFHPDDMSGIILTSYHRKLNKEEIDLAGQIKYYQDFYKNTTVKNDTIFYPNNQTQFAEELEALRKLFHAGDTVLIGIYAPEKRFFQTYATSVTGYAVINNTEKLTAEIIKIENHRRRKPEKKVGDTVTLDLLNVSLIPPRNWN